MFFSALTSSNLLHFALNKALNMFWHKAIYFFFNKFNIFSLPAPVVISMTNCVSLGFGDTITWDELYGAILCLLGCFLHVIKQIAIYFSCLADCCNSVSPRSSGNVSRTTNLLLIVILGELLLSEHEFERKSKWLYIMFQIIMRRKTNLQMMLTCR